MANSNKEKVLRLGGIMKERKRLIKFVVTNEETKEKILLKKSRLIC